PAEIASVGADQTLAVSAYGTFDLHRSAHGILSRSAHCGRARCFELKRWKAAHGRLLASGVVDGELALDVRSILVVGHFDRVGPSVSALCAGFDPREKAVDHALNIREEGVVRGFGDDALQMTLGVEEGVHRATSSTVGRGLGELGCSAIVFK